MDTNSRTYSLNPSAEKRQTFFYNNSVISRALIGRGSLSTKESRPLKWRYNGAICFILSLGAIWLKPISPEMQQSMQCYICHYCDKREKNFTWEFFVSTQTYYLLNRTCYLFWDRPDPPDPDPFLTKASPVWVIIKSWLNWLPSFFWFRFGRFFMW